MRPFFPQMPQRDGAHASSFAKSIFGMTVLINKNLFIGEFAIF